MLGFSPISSAAISGGAQHLEQVVFITGEYAACVIGDVVVFSKLDVSSDEVGVFVGGVGKSASVAQSGVAKAIYLGDIQTGAAILLSSVVANIALGTFTPQVSVYAVRLVVEVFAGIVNIVWANVNDEQTSDWQVINDAQTNTWPEIVTPSGTWAAVNDSQVNVWVPVVDAQTSDWNTIIQ